MKQILLDFWQFIKHPKDFRDTSSNKWKVFFTLFVFELILLSVYLPATALLNKYIVLEQSLDLSSSAVGSLFLFVLFIPFIEEVVFRLGLRRKHITASVFSEKEWHHWFPFFVYSSTIIFGFIHLTNYANTQWIFFALAPFIVLTQLVGGFIMVYLRVRFNFWMGYLYHASWNFTMIFIVGLVLMEFTVPVHLKTDKYELQIQEKQFSGFMGSKEITTQRDTLDNIMLIKSEGYTMIGLLNVICPKDSIYIGKPVLVDFNFTAEKGISKDSLLMILENEGYIVKRK